MKSTATKIALAGIAVLFSAGLIFATLELPYLFDHLIQSSFAFPGYDQEASTLQMSKAEIYYQHLHIKTIGYISLLVIFALVIAGFVTNKLNLSLLGAVALFIPIFGHFTVTMFFLAGLGFLRFLWIPFTEVSPVFMRLGDILLIPDNWIVGIGRWFDADIQYGTSVFFISAGILLFVIGVYNWLSNKFNQEKVVTSWTYKISRHPQYLGWILWSYGLYIMPVDAQKRVWSYSDSLPLLLTIMIIITISLFEELKMTRKYGDDYRIFKAKTAFMFPLPEAVKKMIKHPVRIFCGDYSIDSKGKALLFSGYYTLLLMLASYVYLSISNPEFSNRFTENRHLRQMNEYIHDLETSDQRRAKDIAAMHLSEYGTLAVAPLSELLQECDPGTNNFVIRTLGEIGNADACGPIFQAYESGKVELSYEVIMALGKLRCNLFETQLIHEIYRDDSRVKSYAAWYLGQIQSDKAVEPLLNHYPVNEKFTQMAFLEALGNIKDRKAIELMITELENEDADIVDAAIIALANLGDAAALKPLQRLGYHENWEVRLYARQAIENLSR